MFAQLVPGLATDFGIEKICFFENTYNMYPGCPIQTRFS